MSCRAQLSPSLQLAMSLPRRTSILIASSVLTPQADLAGELDRAAGARRAALWGMNFFLVALERADFAAAVDRQLREFTPRPVRSFRLDCFERSGDRHHLGGKLREFSKVRALKNLETSSGLKLGLAFSADWRMLCIVLSFSCPAVSAIKRLSGKILFKAPRSPSLL